MNDLDRIADRIVSSEAEELILVDSGDRMLGHLSKAACHDGEGVLHRAFSLFLFNAAGELLLQQRSEAKRLWPGFWSNSCCSHPRRGETLEIATRRRLEDELNVAAKLEYAYKFEYRADFGARGAEHELCHVFLGRLDDPPEPNGSEISAIRYIGAEDLDREFEARLSRSRFTPWFRLEWQTLREHHAARLDAYLRPAG